MIAEGVENPAQLETLRALGCEYAQGFLLSEPLDAQATERLIADWRQRGQAGARGRRPGLATAIRPAGQGVGSDAAQRGRSGHGQSPPVRS